MILGAAMLAALIANLSLGVDPAASVSTPSAVTEFQPQIIAGGQTFPWGGRSTAVTVSPANSLVAIVAAESGGLWKTSDGGTNWSHIDSFPLHHVQDVQYDPANASVVIATTVVDGAPNSGGIWRSSDGGATWAKPATSDSPDVACTVARTARQISFGSGGYVFVGTDCGIAVSNNSGATWTHADPDPATSQRLVWDVVAQPGGIVDICGEDGHHRSVNNGGNWTLFSTALPAGYCSIDASPFESNVLFATADNRLWESDNGGAGWQDLGGPAQAQHTRPPYVETHLASDGHPNHFDLYYGNRVVTSRQHCVNSTGTGLRCPVQAENDAANLCPAGSTAACGTNAACSNAVDDDGDHMINEGCPRVGSSDEGPGLALTACKDATDNDPADDGATPTVNDGCPAMEHFDVGAHADPTDLAFDTSTPGGCPLFSVNDGGVDRSTNCGVTWTVANKGLHALQVYQVAGTVHPDHTDLYFGTQDNRVWASADGGATWPWSAADTEGGHIQAVHSSPGHGNQVTYWGANGGTAITDDHMTRPSEKDWPDPPGGGGIPYLIAAGRYAQATAPVAQNGAPETGNQCSNGTDDDGDTVADDGCTYLFISEPETGAQCGNNTDDDQDTGFNNAGAGAVNDGCPADGPAETGTQCHNNADDDGDGKVNDGCSHIYSGESGGECGNAADDDGDGVVNDGCPRAGSFSEADAQCLDAVDAPDEDPNTGGAQDDDAVVNDGCPQVGVWAQIQPALPPLVGGSPLFIAGPPSAPTIYIVTERFAGNFGLSKVTGISNGAATISPADTGLNNLARYCRSLICPIAVGVDPNNPLHLIGADQGTGQMKVSTDGGNSWSPDAELTTLVTGNGARRLIDPNWGTQVRSVAFDPTDGDRILVGTVAVGIFGSVDGGEDWIRIPGSDRIPEADSFFFDEVQDTIIVSSYGRGLWKLTLPETDLSITKTDFPDPVMAGQELFYTITVTNNGPNPATAEVTDNLPPQVQYIGNDLTPPMGCTETSSGILRCDVGVLDTGGSITFTIKVRVRSGAAVSTGGGSLTIINTATVRSTDATDPNLTNNLATATTFAEDLSDLKVTKICKPDGPLAAGETGTCTIYVDNLGPSDARNVVMEDSILADGTFTIGTVTPSQGTCDPPTPGNVVHCDLGNLAAVSTASPGRATVTIDVTAREAMDINDVATATSDTPDLNKANNQAQESLSVYAVSDLALTKTGPGSVVAGNTMTYNLSVTNNGPSTAQEVIIDDTLSASVQVLSVSGSGGATCNAGTPGDPFLPTRCSFGTLAPAASRTMTISVKVKPDVLGVIHNDARTYSHTFDDDASNNLKSVATIVTAEADLSITKSATPNPVIAGTALSYQINVTNNGPSLADDVAVSDPLPAALSVTGSSASSGLCGLETNTNTVTCHLGDLMPGEGATIFIYTNVAASTLEGTVLTNTATVSSATTDPVAGNNSATVSTSVIARADLSVTLTSDKDVYKPSTVIHYVITVLNSGPSDAQSVVTTQVLPDKKTGFYVSNTAGCPLPVGGVFTCNLGTIKAGESKSYQLNFFIRGNKRTITQTVNVSAATVDPDPSDNWSTRVVTVK